MAYETVIGLEVHLELLTKSKLFCGCENRFGAEPNSLVCPVCLGLPGVLPVINEEAVNKHLLAALALNCEISGYSKFDRKNYFYPDMPKNYQISQYDLPLAKGGYLEIEDDQGQLKRIGIRRIHLEEDTGKIKHQGESGSISGADYTLLDFNRAGVPLLEIVTEPEISSPSEAYKFLEKLKNILRWLGVSDCKMEEGSLRCDANISLRDPGSSTAGVKTEIKNMNSFKSVKDALKYEQMRQEEILNAKGTITQETRGWDEVTSTTIPMRSKEEEHDYRYFPEPDLPPLKVGADWIEKIKQALPELPQQMASRFVEQYGIPEYDAGILTSYRAFAEFFEKAVAACGNSKQVSNWMMGDVMKYLNENQVEIQDTNLTPEDLGRMIELIDSEAISGKIGKKLVAELLKEGGPPEKIIRDNNWMQIVTKEELMPHIKKAIDENPDVLQQYLEGKETTREFFIGQVMKATQGKASPKYLNVLLDYELKVRKGEQADEPELPESAFTMDMEEEKEVPVSKEEITAPIPEETKEDSLSIEDAAFAATVKMLSSAEGAASEEAAKLSLGSLGLEVSGEKKEKPERAEEKEETKETEKAGAEASPELAEAELPPSPQKEKPSLDEAEEVLPGTEPPGLPSLEEAGEVPVSEEGVEPEKADTEKPAPLASIVGEAQTEESSIVLEESTQLPSFEEEEAVPAEPSAEEEEASEVSVDLPALEGEAALELPEEPAVGESEEEAMPELAKEELPAEIAEVEELPDVAELPEMEDLAGVEEIPEMEDLMGMEELPEIPKKLPTGEVIEEEEEQNP